MYIVMDEGMIYLALVAFSCVSPATEICREKLLGDVLLCDHVIYWCLLGCGCDSVQCAKCESKQTAAVTLSE